MLESRYLQDNIENIQKLLAIPALKNFETKSLGKLLRLSKIREYEDGERIIKEGDFDPWLYFLLSGKIRITKEGLEYVATRCGDGRLRSRCCSHSLAAGDSSTGKISSVPCLLAEDRGELPVVRGHSRDCLPCEKHGRRSFFLRGATSSCSKERPLGKTCGG